MNLRKTHVALQNLPPLSLPILPMSKTCCEWSPLFLVTIKPGWPRWTPLRNNSPPFKNSWLCSLLFVNLQIQLMFLTLQKALRVRHTWMPLMTNSFVLSLHTHFCLTSFRLTFFLCPFSFCLDFFLVRWCTFCLASLSSYLANPFPLVCT